MKQIVIVLIAVLIAVYVALSVLGSNSEYAAERLFYRAVKTNSRLAINPDVAPPAMLKAVENDLNRILKRFSGTNTAMAAHVALAEFYLSHKKYDQALAAINNCMGLYKHDVNILSRMQFLKGMAYEKQDRWDKALREYILLRDKYSTTSLGMQIPLYIGRYYLIKEMDGDAGDAYNKAIVFYKELEKKNRNNINGYAAANLLLRVYMDRRQYEKAGKTVQDIINNYPLMLSFRDQLPNIEIIYVKLLNRPEKAVEIFKSIQDKVKDPKIKEFLQKRMDLFVKSKAAER
jgi:tetratricopeptide (TPR) repeat protein